MQTQHSCRVLEHGGTMLNGLLFVILQDSKLAIFGQIKCMVEAKVALSRQAGQAMISYVQTRITPHLPPFNDEDPLHRRPIKVEARSPKRCVRPRLVPARFGAVRNPGHCSRNVAHCSISFVFGNNCPIVD